MENFLICRRDYFDDSNKAHFWQGWPYRVLLEHTASDGTPVLEVQDEDGKTAFLKQETVREFFFEDVPGSLYGVRRCIDELPDGEYGTDVSNYLVGAFSSLDAAVKTWATLRQEEGGNEAYYLFVFTPDHIYNRDEEPYLGGVRYIE